MRDWGLVALRAVTGSFLAGHGAQKLFGSFGGHGLQGTAGFMESLGHRPGKPWAMLAGGSEFAGGVLTALGFLHPIGPITALAPMVMATGTVHWGKPVWGTAGGAELPVTNIAVATALILSGPGKLSLDHAFAIRLPKPLIALAMAGTAAGVAVGLMTRQPQPPKQEVQTGAQLQDEAAKPEQFEMSDAGGEKAPAAAGLTASPTGEKE